MNTTELVNEVAANNKLKEAKKTTAKRNWVDIAFASGVTGLLLAVDMAECNVYASKVTGEEGPYSLKDIAKVAVAGAVCGGVVRAALDYTPMAKDLHGRVCLTAGVIAVSGMGTAAISKKFLGIPSMDVLELAEEE